MQVPAVLAWMLFAAHTAAAGKGARVLVEFSLTSFDYQVLRARWEGRNTTGKAAHAEVPGANAFPNTQMTSQGHMADPADPTSPAKSPRKLSPGLSVDMWGKVDVIKGMLCTKMTEGQSLCPCGLLGPTYSYSRTFLLQTVLLLQLQGLWSI